MRLNEIADEGTLTDAGYMTTAMALDVIRKRRPAMRRRHSTAYIRCRDWRYMCVFGCLCGETHVHQRRVTSSRDTQEWRERHETCAARIASRLMVGI